MIAVFLDALCEYFTFFFFSFFFDGFLLYKIICSFVEWWCSSCLLVEWVEWSSVMWIFISVIVLMFVGGEELLIFNDEWIFYHYLNIVDESLLIRDSWYDFVFKRIVDKNRNYFKLLVLLVNSGRNWVNNNRMLYFITLYINCTSLVFPKDFSNWIEIGRTAMPLFS